ncbi:RteC domain-containing protein [Cloacibacterium normanense]|uniref:RteC domain-containing protein n=1 Tax=Cloacibacterium normanense TaxID=237258 RepID=UPI00391BDFB1
METNLLLRKIEKLSTVLEVNLSKMEKEIPDVIVLCEHALMEIDEKIRLVKAMVTQHEFEDMAQEIYFFKKIKPHLISKFIYYSKILELESNKPNLGTKAIRKYYESILNSLKNFYKENTNFYNYYRRKATYMDHQYFVRYQHDLKKWFNIQLHNFDEHFTTSHDDLVAQIIAHDLLEKYLLNAIKNINNDAEKEIMDISMVQWTAPKVNLIELIYALHQTKCFNGGNIELSEIIRHTEKNLQINLTGFHKILGEIKARKKERTKFLQLLNDNLNQIFLDADS